MSFDFDTQGHAQEFVFLYETIAFHVTALITRIQEVINGVRSYVSSDAYDNPLEDSPVTHWKTHGCMELAAPPDRVDNPREFCSLSTVHEADIQKWRYGHRCIAPENAIPRTEMFMQYDDGQGDPVPDVHSFGVQMDGLLRYETSTGLWQDAYVTGNTKNTLKIVINGTEYYIPLYHEVSA